MGPPEVGTKKKSRKIFFLWPQSTKKVTHVPVFEEKKLQEARSGRRLRELRLRLEGSALVRRPERPRGLSPDMGERAPMQRALPQ